MWLFLEPGINFTHFVKDNKMQTADHCFSSVVVSQDSGLDKIGLQYWQYSQCGAHSGREMLLEQTVWPCDANKHLCGLRVNTRNHFHSTCGIVLSSLLQTDKFTVVLMVFSYSLFHLLWLCLPIWVLGLLEDAPGLVAEVALLGTVLLPVLLVVWWPVLASVNLFDWGDLCSLACSFSAFN